MAKANLTNFQEIAERQWVGKKMSNRSNLDLDVYEAIQKGKYKKLMRKSTGKDKIQKRNRRVRFDKRKGKQRKKARILFTWGGFFRT